MTTNDVTPNPYKAPSTGDLHPNSNARGLSLRIVAVLCWIVSLLPIWMYLLIADRPEVLEKRELNPVRFWLLCAVVFGLPAIGLAAFGVASWRRSRQIAILGAAAFLPIVIWTVLAYVFRGD